MKNLKEPSVSVSEIFTSRQSEKRMLFCYQSHQGKREILSNLPLLVIIIREHLRILSGVTNPTHSTMMLSCWKTVSLWREKKEKRKRKKKKRNNIPIFTDQIKSAHSLTLSLLSSPIFFLSFFLFSSSPQLTNANYWTMKKKIKQILLLRVMSLQYMSDHSSP